MILVDTNLLVYAVAAPVEQHQVARRWLESRLSGRERVGLPWATLLGYLRIVTNPRILAQPVSMRDAWRSVRGWLALPPVWIPEPTPAHADVLDSLMPAVTGSSLVPDAHLAALAIEHGLVLCSSDGDFARFDRLRWENPLAAPD